LKKNCQKTAGGIFLTHTVEVRFFKRSQNTDMR